jgi:integrase
LWATAFYGGLRRRELYALRAEDVDLAAGVIHVRRGWDAVEGEIEPKSTRSRRRCRSLRRCATTSSNAGSTLAEVACSEAPARRAG